MKKNKVIEWIQLNVSRFLDHAPSFKSFRLCSSPWWKLLNLKMMKLPTRGNSYPKAIVLETTQIRKDSKHIPSTF